MSPKDQLIQKYADQDNHLSRRELGQLRRYVLTELLETILANNGQNAYDWLDKSKTKLDKAKLAKSVGYGAVSDSMRQTFVKVIGDSEGKLRELGIITDVAKTNIQKSNDNLVSFTAFLHERLGEPSYHWPKNVKGFLYRKAIWAYFLDIPPDEVKYMPGFITSNDDLKELLSDIDVRISRGLVKNLPYDNQSASDEMDDTMTSRALSVMRNKLKDKTEEVVMLREELEELKEELEQHDHREKALLKGSINAFKRGSTH